jgi:hypothetical protein
MPLDLTTTNVLLGIMAAVSLLQVLAIAGVFLGTFLIYRRLMQVVAGIEERQVAPAVARVNAILDDVKDVTSTVRQGTSRFDRLVDWLVDAIGGKHRRSGDSSSSRIM